MVDTNDNKLIPHVRLEIEGELMSIALRKAANHLVSVLRSEFRYKGIPPVGAAYYFEVSEQSLEGRRGASVEIGSFGDLLGENLLCLEAIREIPALSDVRVAMQSVIEYMDESSAIEFSTLFDQLLKLPWLDSENVSEEFPDTKFKLTGSKLEYEDGEHDSKARFKAGYTLAEVSFEFLFNLKVAIDEIKISEYSRPRSPAEWAKIYNRSWKSIKKMIDNNQIDAIELHSKSWRIRIDHLP